MKKIPTQPKIQIKNANNRAGRRAISHIRTSSTLCTKKHTKGRKKHDLSHV